MVSGENSLHKKTSDNGFRLVFFAFFVAVKVRIRLCAWNNTRICDLVRFLNRSPVALRNSFRMLPRNRRQYAVATYRSLLAHYSWKKKNVGYRRQLNSTWYDEKCRQVAIEKIYAYQTTLLSAATQAICEKYRQKKREGRRLYSRKKHAFMKAKCELVCCMHDLLCNIWSQAIMPSDWSLSILCPVLENGVATHCAKYRTKSLLSIAYGKYHSSC